MEFLIGSLFSTPIGTRIEHATSSSLQSEDWALNMEICDLVNSSEEGPRDAVKAIRKRIVGNKNFKEVMYTLTVLEACVKNCGHRFHVLVSMREFIEGVLVRSIIPKNNPPLVLHDRVLSLIQAWADAFRSSPDLTGVVSVYEDLRRKGLDFPPVQLDGLSAAKAKTRKSLPVNGALSIPPHPKAASNQPHSKEENNVFNPNKVMKLKADMAAVQSNLTVMADMMSQLDPVTAKQADVEMLQQLYLVCKAMQDRIVELVPSLSEEQLIEELLAVNDVMNTTFTRYHRFERQMTNGDCTTPKTPTYVNLSELGLASKPVHQSTVEAVSSQFVNLSTGESDSDACLPQTNISESQQRQSERGEAVVDGVASGHAHCVQSHGMIPLNQSTMMDDIEKWLDYDDENADFDDTEGVTSAEFDRFLAGRAQAAERLPSLRTPSLDHSPPGTCSADLQPPCQEPL